MPHSNLTNFTNFRRALSELSLTFHTFFTSNAQMHYSETIFLRMFVCLFRRHTPERKQRSQNNEILCYGIIKLYRSIEISGARSLPAEIFNAFLALHPKLTELEISPLPVADDMTLSYISDLGALKSLYLGYIQKEAHDLPMEPIAFCATLQCLHFQVSFFIPQHSSFPKNMCSTSNFRSRKV